MKILEKYKNTTSCLFRLRCGGIWMCACSKCNIIPHRFFLRKSQSWRAGASFLYMYNYGSYKMPVLSGFIFTKYNTMRFKAILSRFYWFANLSANQLEKYIQAKPIYKSLNINPIE